MEKENAGFITISRKLLQWEWADDSGMMSLWIHLLLRANHEDRKWHGITIKRGQLVTSYSKLAKYTGLTEKEIRTRIQRLEDGQCLGRQRANKYSILTIYKYDSYQRIQSLEGRIWADKGQAEGRQRATNNNENNNNILSSSCACTHACEEKIWTSYDVVTKDNVPPLTDAWTEEVQMLIHRQMQIMLTADDIAQHYKDFQAQEISEISQDSYQEWRKHFGNYVRKRETIKHETSTNNQHLSRDEQRASEKEQRRTTVANRIAERIASRSRTP